eukprot:6188174-Pleurochrysis_carterae.AAC.1
MIKVTSRIAYWRKQSETRTGIKSAHSTPQQRAVPNSERTSSVRSRLNSSLEGSPASTRWPSARVTFSPSKRKPRIELVLICSRNCMYRSFVMPPCARQKNDVKSDFTAAHDQTIKARGRRSKHTFSLSSAVAAEESSLSIFFSRSGRSFGFDTSSSRNVRIPILISITHGESPNPAVRSCSSIQTESACGSRPSQWASAMSL